MNLPPTKQTTWRFLTDEEFRNLPKKPQPSVPVKLGRSLEGIFTVAEDGVLLHGNEPLFLPKGKRIRLLDFLENCQEETCRVVHVRVHLPGGGVGSLKEGTLLGILHDRRADGEGAERTRSGTAEQ